MHPSDGTLRRSLDEPVAVDPAGREHIATCARCAERVQRMSADATWVQAMRARSAAHPIEAVGEKLRGMMPWIAKNKLVDKAKN